MIKILEKELHKIHLKESESNLKKEKEDETIKQEAKKWNLSNEETIFFQTELIKKNEDYIIIKSKSDKKINKEFLLLHYDLEMQRICKEIFGEEKNIILVCDYCSLKSSKESLIFLKNEEMIKKNIKDWISKFL